MKVIEPGHIYQLEHQDGTGAGMLVFVNREHETEHEGTQTQEVLRALIDRTQHCDSCLRWPGNDQIIEHLRMALVLHEARALERKTAKGELKPEKIATSDDGHFALSAVAHARAHAQVLERKKAFNVARDMFYLDPSTTTAVEYRSIARDCHDKAELREVTLDDVYNATAAYVGITDRKIPRYDPEPLGPRAACYHCSVPMCGERGVCEECMRRGAR